MGVYGVWVVCGVYDSVYGSLCVWWCMVVYGGVYDSVWWWYGGVGCWWCVCDGGVCV